MARIRRILSLFSLAALLLLLQCQVIAAQKVGRTTDTTGDHSDFVDEDVVPTAGERLDRDEETETVTSATVENVTEASSSADAEQEEEEEEEEQEASEGAGEDDNEEVIMVRSNLESMSDEELESICQERGFEVQGDGDDKLTHDDYVEAAMRCLSLEDEMNAILAENPDLAAELEVEIERMKEEKDRLLAERDAMIAEMKDLEDKLQQAGIDPENIAVQNKPSVTIQPSHQDLTVEETLRQSFVMLFDRVGKDMRLAGKIARYVLRPAGGGLILIWRYTGPSIEQGVGKAIALVQTVLDVDQIVTVRRIISSQLRVTLNLVHRFVLPVLAKARESVVEALEHFCRHEKIRKAGAIAGAVLGPLRDSLISGWRSVKPDLLTAKNNVGVWIQKVKNRSKPQTL